MLSPRAAQYFERAQLFLQSRSSGQPIPAALKSFFKQYPEMGSGDRKTVSDILYAWIRCQKLWKDAVITTELLHKSWLIVYGKVKMGAQLFAHYLPQVEELGTSPSERFQQLTGEELALDIFPNTAWVSDQIPIKQLSEAFLSQARVFIRVKSGVEDPLMRYITDLGLAVRKDGPKTWSFPIQTSLQSLQEKAEGWFEIQDWASQDTLQLMAPKGGERWWDCCAASGGKSLMLYDAEPQVRLYVSDKRESILQNLSQRFQKAGLKQYARLCVDLDFPLPLADAGSFPSQFDAILVDAPCSGSGTWRRAPEIAGIWPEGGSEKLVERQAKILDHVWPYVKTGGKLIYLTCSVYAIENEDQVQSFAARSGGNIQVLQYFNRLDEGGDVLFGAVLIKV